MAKLALSTDSSSLERLPSDARKGGCLIPESVGDSLGEHTPYLSYPEGFFKLNGSLQDMDFACPDDEIPAPIELVM